MKYGLLINDVGSIYGLWKCNERNVNHESMGKHSTRINVFHMTNHGTFKENYDFWKQIRR